MDPVSMPLWNNPEYIIISSSHFHSSLLNLLYHASSSLWREDPLYGVINFVLVHFCLTVSIAGSAFATLPQLALASSPDQVTEELSYRFRRIPDFSTFMAFKGVHPHWRTPIRASRLVFWWEAKPLEDADWRFNSSKILAASSTFTHFDQLIGQAQYAFATYGLKRHYAFLSVATHFTLVLFTNPAYANEEDQDRSSMATPTLSDAGNPRKRQHLDTDGLGDDPAVPQPVIIFFAEPMFLGTYHNMRINSLFLHALRLASAQSNISFQPSFMQIAPDYTPSVSTVHRASRANDQWAAILELRAMPDPPSSSPRSTDPENRSFSQLTYIDEPSSDNTVGDFERSTAPKLRPRPPPQDDLESDFGGLSIRDASVPPPRAASGSHPLHFPPQTRLLPRQRMGSRGPPPAPEIWDDQNLASSPVADAVERRRIANERFQFTFQQDPASPIHPPQASESSSSIPSQQTNAQQGPTGKGKDKGSAPPPEDDDDDDDDDLYL